MTTFFNLLLVGSLLFFGFTLFPKRKIYRNSTHLQLAVFGIALVIAYYFVGATIKTPPSITRVVLDAIVIIFSSYCIVSGGYFLVLNYGFPEEPEPEPEPEPVPKEPEPELEPEHKPIPLSTRFEHTLILGGTGHGKTSLLAGFLKEDITKPYALVVFDSQGDLVDKLLRVDIPRQRIVYIDPTDVHHPVSLGLFDFDTEGATAYEQQKKINTVTELLTFVLNSLLDSSLTSKQDVVMRYVIRLCLTIPGANILTLRDVLSKGGLSQYIDYLEKLPKTAQDFFRNEYDTSQYRDTKEQILRRIYTILENQTLEAIFSSTTTRLDFKKSFDEGQIVLVNSAKSFLKEEGSAFFSRFIMALIYQATQERELYSDLTPAFVYIDESAPIIDQNIATMLETARKFKVGMILAFQYLGQIPAHLQQSVITNTSIKYLGGLGAKDATTLSKDVGTIPEVLLTARKMEFWEGVKGRAPYLINVHYGALGSLPKRNDLKDLLAENREKYSAKPKKQATHTAPDDPLAEYTDT